MNVPSFTARAMCAFSSLLLACSSLSPKNSNEPIACSSTLDPLTGTYIYHNLDSLPHYENGSTGVMDFFIENFSYPDQEHYQGSVNLEFIVTENGTIIGGRILNKQESDYTLVDKEALKVLNAMNNWSPGKCNNDRVASKVILPVKW